MKIICKMISKIIRFFWFSLLLNKSYILLIYFIYSKDYNPFLKRNNTLMAIVNIIWLEEICNGHPPLKKSGAEALGPQSAWILNISRDYPLKLEKISNIKDLKFSTFLLLFVIERAILNNI